uniref:DUF4833 domain-containing protein n=1 Tax=Globisporangium ultimum (strain ATCC 200006 / CBS 805.95 / DAOM BR144) TaxID=431595 RepID=K3WVQ5_GLOUD
MTKIHYFTDEFPDKDYAPTTSSTHEQSKLWPAYLPVSTDRVFIFERSKNAQLVVYTANYSDRAKRVLDPKWPLDINWQSFGWTDHPTSNATGMLERKMAWGYSHSRSAGKDGTLLYDITLNALPTRAAQLYFDESGAIVLQTTINGAPSRLWKVFVATGSSKAFIPKVLYVELYGTDVASGADMYERITVA